MKKYYHIFGITFFILINLRMEAQIQLDSVSYYYKNSNFKQSINLCLILEKEFNVKKDTLNKNYRDVLSYQGLSLLKESDFDKAKKYFLRVLKIDEIIFSKNSNEYSSNLNNLAMSFYNNQEYNKAIELYNESLNLKEKREGKTTLSYAVSLNNLALVYKKQKEYDYALKLFRKVLNIKKKNNLNNSLNYATTLNNIGSIYLSKREYLLAEKYSFEAYNIRKGKIEESYLDYISSLNSMAVIYNLLDKKTESEILYVKAFELLNTRMSNKNPDIINVLNNIISFYKNNNQYENLKSIYDKEIDVYKDQYGEKSSEYAITLDNQALFYAKKLHVYDRAIILNQNALVIFETIGGKNNEDYLIAIFNRGLIFQYKGDKIESLRFYSEFNQSRKQNCIIDELYLKSLINTYNLLENVLDKQYVYKELLSSINKVEIKSSEVLYSIGKLFYGQNEFEKAKKYFLQSLEYVDKKDDLYPIILSNLGLLLTTLSDFKSAEAYSLEAIDIMKDNPISNFEQILTLQNNLALLYTDIGEYSKAESLFLDCINKIEKKEGKLNSSYIIYLDNLGVLYSLIGLGDKRAKIILENYSLRKELYGENHIEFSKSLNAISQIYNDLENHEKASEYIQRAIKIRLDNNIIDFNTSIMCHNSGQILYYLEKYEDAITWFDLSKRQQEILKLTKNRDYLNNINCLAAVNMVLNKIEIAESYFLEANKIVNDNELSILEYLLIKKNTALFYESVNKNDLSANYFSECIGATKKNTIDNILFLSQSDLLNIFETNYDSNNHINSFLFRENLKYPELNIGCYENDMLMKNLSLRNQQRISNNIKKSHDNELQNKYEQFVLNKKQLTKLNELPKDKRPSNYEQINSETETLEKDLVRQSSSFADSNNALSITWRQVQAKLKTNEVAISLIAFNYYNKKWTDSIVYSAFVVGRDYKVPKFITLFEQKQLEILLAGNDETKQMNKIDKQYTDKALSDLLLKPLKKELEEITNIYLSPSGLGHQIDFAALPINDSQTLGEKYKLHILSSPAELIDYKVATLDNKSDIELLLYGGIDYNNSSANANQNINLLANDEDFINSAKRSGLEKLPGTLIEVEGINSNAKINSFNSKILKESEATEESVKALDGRTTPYVLHLATHGFFFPDPIQETQKDNKSFEGKSKIYKASDDPMMRSGLLLAGAKNYWGKANQNNIIEDGILTANEISNLDLSACQLVVLSACETGLGEVKGSEGVFGLQRAFKMAGVKKIIMSLWKVPDAQTAELFDVFYSECFAGKSIHEAFRSAQAKMKAKYLPYYWAGFVLLE